MFRIYSLIWFCTLSISMPTHAQDSWELKLWKNIRQFEVKLDKLQNNNDLSTLSAKSDELWQSYSGSVVTPCTRTAGTLVQYFKTRRDGGTAADLKFHNNRFVKARIRCLKTLKLNPKKYPAPQLSLVP